MDPPRKASSSLPLPRDTGSVAGLALGRMAPSALAMVAVVLWYVPWSPEVPALGLDYGWRLVLAIACERGWLVRVVAADGFLLSPAVFDVAALQSWLRGDRSAGNTVKRLRVVDDAGAPVPVTLRLSSLPPSSDRPR